MATTINDLMEEMMELENKCKKALGRIETLESFTLPPEPVGELSEPRKHRNKNMTTTEFCAPVAPPPTILGKVPVSQDGTFPKIWKRVQDDKYRGGFAYHKTEAIGVDPQTNEIIYDVTDKEDARIVDGSIRRVKEYNNQMK